MYFRYFAQLCSRSQNSISISCKIYRLKQISRPAITFLRPHTLNIKFPPYISFEGRFISSLMCFFVLYYVHKLKLHICEYERKSQIKLMCATAYSKNSSISYSKRHSKMQVQNHTNLFYDLFVKHFREYKIKQVIKLVQSSHAKDK